MLSSGSIVALAKAVASPRRLPRKNLEPSRPSTSKPSRLLVGLKTNIRRTAGVESYRVGHEKPVSSSQEPCERASLLPIISVARASREERALPPRAEEVAAGPTAGPTAKCSPLPDLDLSVKKAQATSQLREAAPSDLPCLQRLQRLHVCTDYSSRESMSCCSTPSSQTSSKLTNSCEAVSAFVDADLGSDTNMSTTACAGLHDSESTREGSTVSERGDNTGSGSAHGRARTLTRTLSQTWVNKCKVLKSWARNSSRNILVKKPYSPHPPRHHHRSAVAVDELTMLFN